MDSDLTEPAEVCMVARSDILALPADVLVVAADAA